MKKLIKQYIDFKTSLKNKVVVITAGGGYLCSSFAFALVNSGCKVIIVDIREKKLTDIKTKINSKNLLCYTCDLLNKADVDKLSLKIYKKFKKIDILINGVGVNSPKEFEKISKADWNTVIESHLLSTLFGCQSFGKYMKKKNKGSIINVSSASAGPPLSKAFAYSAAKAGVKNLTQNLAREWAKFNIRVNCIRPGFFPTLWNKKNFLDKKRIKSIMDHTPMRRFGKPIELSGAIIWLASDSSSFVTGSEIVIDGGFSCMSI